MSQAATSINDAAEPKPSPSYTLDELLAQCDATAELTDEACEWLHAGKTGRELL